MLNRKLNLSIVIPVCNEEEIIEGSIKRFIKYFRVNRGVGKFEIILSENGSTDGTREIAAELAKTYKPVRLITIPQRSLGRAIKTGIRKARYPYVYFDAIDNPFKCADFEKFLGKINGCDLVFASKNHEKSKYKAKFTRKLASKTLCLLNRILFNLPITDTQGTFMAKRAKLAGLLRYCNSRGAFFQNQLAIHAVRRKLRVFEVPVNFSTGGRKSNFSLARDGWALLGDLVRERVGLFGVK